LSISFVVPAHDEELLIAATLQAIRSAGDASGVSCEIIVVDDGSTDRTAEIAREAGARVVPVHVRHIAAARNAGGRVATGDTLVFVDADTLITPAVVRALLTARASGAIGGGTLVHFDQPLPRYARAWAATFTWMSRRFRLAAGCFLFVARDAFTAVGGFDEAYFAAEEIAFSRTLNRRGRFVILSEPVVTSGRKVRTYTQAEIWRTFLCLMVRPRDLKRRSALDLWYGPRRADKSLDP